MFSIRLGHDQYSDCSVLQRCEQLHARRRVAGVTGAVKDRFRIVLLRLVVEYQHDRTARVEPGVIVVMQLWSSDSVAGEDHGTGNRDVLREIAERIREMQGLLCPALLDGQ